MHRCACSFRALEIFVNDVAGLTIQRTRPRHTSAQSRTFRTQALHRQLAASHVQPERIDSIFLPEGFVDNAAINAGQRIGKKKVTEAPSLSALDEAWNSDSAQYLTPAENEVAKHDDLQSAEDMAVQPESVEMKKMAKKMKGLERKRVRKAEGVWAPVKRENEAKKRNELAAEVTSENGEAAENGAVLTPIAAPKTRRERLRRASNASRDAAMGNQIEKPGHRMRRAERPGEIFETSKQKNASMKAEESRTKTSKVKDASTKPDNTVRPDRTAKSDRPSKPIIDRKPKDKEVWQVQKASLERKFGEQGWQPKKRLSPDTLEGIRALHVSDPGNYNTETLAKHFQITPEAIRRILKSKWRPNEEEAEDRRQRWEKRGVKKWTAMAELGMRPPSKWRQLGVKSQQQEKKRVQRSSKQRRVDILEEGDAEESFAGRIL